MQQLMILLVISSSSTCFGCLYAHRQEVRLRFHCLSFSVLLWLLWSWRVGWQAVCTVWSRLLDMLRNYWLPIKSLIVASSWSHLYLLIKDARSFEYKAYIEENLCITLVIHQESFKLYLMVFIQTVWFHSPSYQHWLYILQIRWDVIHVVIRGNSGSHSQGVSLYSEVREFHHHYLRLTSI